MKFSYNFQRLVVCIGLCVLLVCCVLFFKNKSYAAEKPSEKTLCYKQIHVEEGDCLWSIANEHYTEEWKSTKSYVKAIKEFNDMNSYEVYAGTYISIPYYTIVEE